tara:strand:+ start:73 stop:501 length:429 start_codon:yes stop_codon:yes gene_type:complete
MDFGKKLKSLLKANDMSQIQFAELIDMNYEHSNKFFTGRKPNVDYLKKVLKVFPEVDLKWLILDNDEYSTLNAVYNSNLEDFSIADLKALYDFLDIRKNVVSHNKEQFNNNEIHEIINNQKNIWVELDKRTKKINGLDTGKS